MNIKEVFPIHAYSACKVACTYIFILCMSLSSLSSQGCLPGKHIPPNLGVNSQSYLVDGQWEASISYRHLRSNTFFIGTEAQVEYKEQGLEARMGNHSFNISTRYSVNQRLSLTLNVPLININESDIHYDGLRHTQSTGTQIGDLRLVGNWWLKDPLTFPKGNISLGLGFKLPTGSSTLDGTFYTPAGPTTRDFDMALQAGDGGLGIILEGDWFYQFSDQLSARANVHYIVNPRGMNTSLAQWFDPGDPFFTDSPDQYNLGAGLNFAFGSFALSVGGRFDGIPVNDLIGSSDGFRRPGNILYLDNGLMWSDIINTIYVGFPIALHRNIITSNLDESLGIQTLGGLADYLKFVSYTRRF